MIYIEEMVGRSISNYIVSFISSNAKIEQLIKFIHAEVIGQEKALSKANGYGFFISLKCKFVYISVFYHFKKVSIIFKS